MFNLSKEEMFILGLSAVAFGAAIWWYAKKKGKEQAYEEIKKLQELANNTAMTVSEKQAAAAAQLNNMAKA